MRSRREDEILLEMYEQIRLNENIDDERKKINGISRYDYSSCEYYPW